MFVDLPKDKDNCQMCGNIHNKQELFINKKDGKKWCPYCLGIEKLKRETGKYGKTLGKRTLESKRKVEWKRK